MDRQTIQWRAVIEVEFHALDLGRCRIADGGTGIGEIDHLKIINAVAVGRHVDAQRAVQKSGFQAGLEPLDGLRVIGQVGGRDIVDRTGVKAA
jgi:hypothetical protein